MAIIIHHSIHYPSKAIAVLLGVGALMKSRDYAKSSRLARWAWGVGFLAPFLL
jgi:hypothetical protein